MEKLSKEDIKSILGRNQHSNLLELNSHHLNYKKILITGSEGSLGKELYKRIYNNFEGEILLTDIEGGVEHLDVTRENQVNKILKQFNPDLIFHLAGAKHAPIGEIKTEETFQINTIGTLNIVNNLSPDSRLILASTCKAANPEVVYGASKLIAERIVLNNGGSVARFFNVIETAGNVFEIWSNLGVDKPIEVASLCERHFISLGEAIGLLIYSAYSMPGRFLVNSSALIKMTDVADRLYPKREKVIISPRRGDRISEKFLASSESIEKYLLNNEVIKVNNIHDKI